MIQAVNPGNLKSELYRSIDDIQGSSRIGLQIFTRTMLWPVVYGAYTELFAGLSPKVTIEKTGAWSKFSLAISAWFLLSKKT